MVRYRRIDEWLKDTFNSDPGVYEVKSFKIGSFFIFFRRILEQTRTIGKKLRLAKEYEMLKMHGRGCADLERENMQGKLGLFLGEGTI